LSQVSIKPRGFKVDLKQGTKGINLNDLDSTMPMYSMDTYYFRQIEYTKMLQACFTFTSAILK